MKERIVLTVIMTTIGVVLGYSAWKRHKQLAGQEPDHHLVRVWPWLSWLCGRPLPDNQVELEFIVFQLLNLLFTLLWAPLLMVFGINNLLVPVLVVIYLVVVCFVPLAVQSILNIVDILKRRRQ